jgi:hypothetical protein
MRRSGSMWIFSCWFPPSQSCTKLNRKKLRVFSFWFSPSQSSTKLK